MQANARPPSTAATSRSLIFAGTQWRGAGAGLGDERRAFCSKFGRNGGRTAGGVRDDTKNTRRTKPTIGKTARQQAHAVTRTESLEVTPPRKQEENKPHVSVCEGGNSWRWVPEAPTTSRTTQALVGTDEQVSGLRWARLHNGQALARCRRTTWWRIWWSRRHVKSLRCARSIQRRTQSTRLGYKKTHTGRVADRRVKQTKTHRGLAGAIPCIDPKSAGRPHRQVRLRRK